MKNFLGKIIKTNIMTVIALGIVFSACNLVYASVSQSGDDTKITKHLIDSINFTTIASGSKVNAGQTLNVQVTYMYDDQGDEQTSWKKTKWQVYRVGSTFSDVVTVEKGQYTGITLTSKAGTSDVLTVKAHGNNEAYDTKISGYIYNFKKQ